MAFKNEPHLDKQLNTQVEDTWTNHKEGAADVQSLTHTFGENKALFQIIDNNILFFPNKHVSPYIYEIPQNTIDEIPKMLVDNVITRFELEKSPNNWDMDKYLQSFVDKLKPSPQIETAKKMGYVQGVCECVAAVGDDYTLGKKLLTEMNVNIDMARKYANPEIFKKLEQGIFAQNQEHKLEQTQGVKR